MTDKKDDDYNHKILIQYADSMDCKDFFKSYKSKYLSNIRDFSLIRLNYPLLTY